LYGTAKKIMHSLVPTFYSLTPAYLGSADVLSQVVSAASKLLPKPLASSISIASLFLTQLGIVLISMSSVHHD
jgi:hypothetical protein